MAVRRRQVISLVGPAMRRIESLLVAHAAKDPRQAVEECELAHRGDPADGGHPRENDERAVALPLVLDVETVGEEPLDFGALDLDRVALFDFVTVRIL